MPVREGLVEAQVRGQGGSGQGRWSPGLDSPRLYQLLFCLTSSGP